MPEFPYKARRAGITGMKWYWPLTCPVPTSPQFAKAVTDRMPDDVPVLTEKDICRGRYTSGRRKCLSEWIEETFRGCGGHAENIATIVLTEVCAEHSGERASFMEFEERPEVTDELAAQCWNEMLNRLGYDTSNPKTDEDEYFGEAFEAPTPKSKPKKKTKDIPVEDRDDYFE